MKIITILIKIIMKKNSKIKKNNKKNNEKNNKNNTMNNINNNKIIIIIIRISIIILTDLSSHERQSIFLMPFMLPSMPQ